MALEEWWVVLGGVELGRQKPFSKCTYSSATRVCYNAVVAERSKAVD